MVGCLVVGDSLENSRLIHTEGPHVPSAEQALSQSSQQPNEVGQATPQPTDEALEAQRNDFNPKVGGGVGVGGLN